MPRLSAESAVGLLADLANSTAEAEKLPFYTRISIAHFQSNFFYTAPFVKWHNDKELMSIRIGILANEDIDIWQPSLQLLPVFLDCLEEKTSHRPGTEIAFFNGHDVGKPTVIKQQFKSHGRFAVIAYHTPIRIILPLPSFIEDFLLGREFLRVVRTKTLSAGNIDFPQQIAPAVKQFLRIDFL